MVSDRLFFFAAVQDYFVIFASALNAGEDNNDWLLAGGKRLEKYPVTMQIIHQLANGNVLKYNDILNVSLSEIAFYYSYESDLAIIRKNLNDLKKNAT